ncbi:MAG: hypothetical protein R2942_14915 [Ignavibacteria bacterium]
MHRYESSQKDYFLDHDHSGLCGSVGLGKTITDKDRNLAYLKDTVKKIWKVLKGAETYAQELFPALKNPKYPDLPEELVFLHAEEILQMYPDLPRKQGKLRYFKSILQCL